MLEKNVYLPECFSFLQDLSLRHLTFLSHSCKQPLESLSVIWAARDSGTVVGGSPAGTGCSAHPGMLCSHLQGLPVYLPAHFSPPYVLIFPVPIEKKGKVSFILS